MDVMVHEQFSRCMIERRYRKLIICLCLSQREFRLRELRLGIENEECGLGAKLMFSFFRPQVFLRKIHIGKIKTARTRKKVFPDFAADKILPSRIN